MKRRFRSVRSSAVCAFIRLHDAQRRTIPSRYIRVIVGPGPDIVARLFGPKITESSGSRW